MSARTRLGAGSWPTQPDARHGYFLQHGLELRRVAALTGRDHNRHGLLALADSQVQLGREPAARASHSVISGLRELTARWFFLQLAQTLPGR